LRTPSGYASTPVAGSHERLAPFTCAGVQHAPDGPAVHRGVLHGRAPAMCGTVRRGRAASPGFRVLAPPDTRGVATRTCRGNRKRHAPVAGERTSTDTCADSPGRLTPRGC